MIHHTRLWTAGLAAAALMALPISSAAHGPATTVQQSGQDELQPSKSPTYHLEQAAKVLDRIEDSSLMGSTASTVREMKSRFAQLRSAYTGGSGSGTSGSTSGSSGATGTGGTSGSGMSGGTMSGDWRQSFNTIQKSLDQLNVPKSSAWMPITGAIGAYGTSGSTSGTGVSGTGAAGTGGSGSSSSTSSASIEPPVMSDLKEFRRHLEEFYKAASGTGPGK
jgi:hypothetical protein